MFFKFVLTSVLVIVTLLLIVMAMTQANERLVLKQLDVKEPLRLSIDPPTIEMMGVPK